MKNKTTFSITIFMVITGLVLAACGAAQSVNANAPTTSTTPGAGGFDLTKMPLESKLAIGILKLEGTPKAVTAQEAQTLLPLWKAVKALGSSTTTSQDEINALYKQIEDALTPDQLTTIQNMTLTGADIQALMASLGIQAPTGGGGGTGFPTLTADQRATRTAARAANGGGAGGPPDGGGPGSFGGFGGGNGGGGGGGGTQRTPVPGAAPRVRGFTQFLDPLINMLTTRAAS